MAINSNSVQVDGKTVATYGNSLTALQVVTGSGVSTIAVNGTAAGGATTTVTAGGAGAYVQVYGYSGSPLDIVNTGGDDVLTVRFPQLLGDQLEPGGVRHRTCPPRQARSPPRAGR